MSLKERNPVLFAIKKQKYRMVLARYMGITPTNGNKAEESGMSTPDCKVDGVWVPDKHVEPAADKCNVQVFASDKQVEPVSDECNVPLPVESATPWLIHGLRVGYYRPASILKTLPGLHDLEESRLQGKRIRQLDSGLFELSDVAAAVLFDDPQVARRYANNTNQVNSRVAPSLVYIDAGHASVSLPHVDFYFNQKFWLLNHVQYLCLVQ